MHKKLVFILTCSILLLTGRGYSQDFHLSQFDAAPLNLNPSLTGLFNGNFRIHGHYRTQWQAIVNKPFQTGYISFDMPIKKGFSFGASIANYNAGTGSYNEFQLMLFGAYKVAMDKKKHHNISIGLQAGFFTKSINFGKLSFGQQYIANANGGMFDPGIPNGETFDNNFAINFDCGVGLTYYYSNQASRINPFVGVSVYHLNVPKETFYGENNKLPLRYVANAGIRIGITETFSLMPKVMYEHQQKANEIVASIMCQFYLKNADLILLAGPTFRSKDAFAIDLGAKWRGLEFRLSYDVNFSTLNVSTSGRGGTEVSLTYIFKKLNPNPIPSCPRL
ncbi:MAG: PorP/SprF family type IX secretion system membrane protein [Crocinitomicaceae bacterium]|nr:PorP/SprF family type IX secretion system membrane protein [Crocinitomicaceae bacterium]